eukprot:1811812-Prymnesium_polylepis.1
MSPRFCFVIAFLAVAVDALRVTPTAAGRRSIVAAAAIVPAAFIIPQALAGDQVCFGKCAEDPARAAERRAIQQGSSTKTPPTFALLVEQSIAQKEKTLGMSLSEEEKKQVEDKVRLAFPGVK